MCAARCIRSVVIAAAVGSTATPGACRAPAHHPEAPPASVATHPRAADRFLLLVRRQLTDSDPALTEQEINCEGERMSRALGPADAAARIRLALDTAYRHHSDSVALRRVGRMLGGLSFGTDPEVCDSMIAAANRIEPIVPLERPPPQP